MLCCECSYTWVYCLQCFLSVSPDAYTALSNEHGRIIMHFLFFYGFVFFFISFSGFGRCVEKFATTAFSYMCLQLSNNCILLCATLSANRIILYIFSSQPNANCPGDFHNN